MESLRSSPAHRNNAAMATASATSELAPTTFCAAISIDPLAWHSPIATHSACSGKIVRYVDEMIVSVVLRVESQSVRKGKHAMILW